MAHSRGFIGYLRKICLILLLTLTLIMLFHILITLFLSTYVSPWNTKSSPIHGAVLVLLYYVIPMITLLFFYLIINEFTKLETPHTPKKQIIKQARRTDKAPQVKKKSTSKHKKKQPLQYSCYTPLNQSAKKNKD